MFFSRIYGSWRGIQEEKYRTILENIDPETFNSLVNGRVLDLGSGSGFFEDFLKGHGFDVSGWVCLDPDPDMLRECGEFHRMLGDGNRLPFRPGSFDSLVCLDAIHLLKEDFSWVLRPGSPALVSLFCNPGNAGERRRLLKDRMRGFRIVREFLSRGRESEVFVVARKS
jgi:SAM-dependent methyltransferase